MIERFTVYDVFAVLVPGVVFNVLLAVALNYLCDVRLLNWQGGFGDATVLLACGYAVGVFLQAIGSVVVTSRPWCHIYGGHARFELLRPGANHYAEGYRLELVGALEDRYGALPLSDDEGYLSALRQQTYRAYKEVAVLDSKVERLLAEHYQMRAYMVAFTVLAIVSLATLSYSDHQSVETHLLASLVFLVLTCISGGQLRSKDVSLARHVHAIFLNLDRDPGSSGGS
jgi:small basic protein